MKYFLLVTILIQGGKFGPRTIESEIGPLLTKDACNVMLNSQYVARLGGKVVSAECVARIDI